MQRLVSIAIAAAVSASWLSAMEAPRTGSAAPVVKSVFEHGIANIPGKSLVAVEVTYAPGGKSSSHRHASSAFIYAYVVSGAIRSQVDDEPVRVYRAGESWHENPGAHHIVSENASATEPARLLAVFVVDAADKQLTVADP